MGVAKAIGFLFAICGLLESTFAHDCLPGYEAHSVVGSDNYECILTRVVEVAQQREVAQPPLPKPLAPPMKQQDVVIAKAVIADDVPEGCNAVTPLGSEQGTTFNLSCRENRAVTRIQIPQNGVPEIMCCLVVKV
ncbi:uncharacterized protein LOC134825017 [Bolinopsis microptera]|uniref:uncharacterized protein LOC134825017 n=1 Tax=Bolinopsis microptera TaxID=2820187 RepID=UPI00307AA784